ncbi:EboA domain-containing protein [Lentzea sp. NPDC060358]|uniref:EboA domain-containing protein n=1 Tax=Lentzea sp. NPDC060358 TaxID=3347103 RepID=UPI003656F56C
MSFHLGYGTNGFSNHRLDDALRVVADLGYTAVALTLDHAHLDPFGPGLRRRVDHVAATLDALGLRCVVETGARYLLDRDHKHHPTLVSDDPSRRIDFLGRAVRIAADLNADCVSFWSGVAAAGVARDLAWSRLRAGVAEVLDVASRHRVRLGLEPEPGMVVQHLAQALALREELGTPELLGITLDVGHCVAVEPDSAAVCLRTAADLLVNVQLDDMVRGVHEHLEFGEGELDLAGTLGALTEIGYTGVAAVELPRHSHAAPAAARAAMTALTGAMTDVWVASGQTDFAAEVDHPWLVAAERRVRRDPGAVTALYPRAGREVGRAPLRPETDPLGLVHGTVDDLARARLVRVLGETLPAARLVAQVRELYDHGDDAERRGVLRGLPLLPESVGEACAGIAEDALRTHDVRLVAAAMGVRALDQQVWRHGVLKCLFTGVPLAAVADLGERADAELLRMVADYAAERRAAGRDLPADAERLLEKS